MCMCICVRGIHVDRAVVLWHRPEVALCGSRDVKIQLLTNCEVEIIMCMDIYTCLSLQVPTNVS